MHYNVSLVDGLAVDDALWAGTKHRDRVAGVPPGQQDHLLAACAGGVPPRQAGLDRPALLGGVAGCCDQHGEDVRGKHHAITVVRTRTTVGRQTSTGLRARTRILADWVTAGSLRTRQYPSDKLVEAAEGGWPVPPRESGPLGLVLSQHEPAITSARGNHEG